MGYLIVSNKNHKTHAIKTIGLMLFPHTECAEDYERKGWVSVKHYQITGKARRAISCLRCLRVLDKMRNKK